MTRTLLGVAATEATRTVDNVIQQTGDEIQTLSQAFNHMTRQLKTQREELVASYEASDAQRRLFEARERMEAQSQRTAEAKASSG